jgi:uncharacterized membrane protein
MVLIISTIVDIAFTLLPYQINDGRWWNLATAEIVNRGLLPLVGIIFWLIADWIESVSKDAGGRRSQTLTKVVTGLAIALGVIFLAIVPFQVFSSNSDRDKLMTINKEEKTQAEASVKQKKAFLSDKTKVQQKIAELDKAVKDGNIQGQDLAKVGAYKAEIEKMSKDPAKAEAADMAIINKAQQDKDNIATAQMWKTGIRAALASLLLSAGYGFIGFNNLRGQKR